MARSGKAYDAAVNQLLGELEDGYQQVGDVDSGGYKKKYKANPYFSAGEDLDSDAVRRRIASQLGVTDFSSSVSYPDETNSGVDMLPWIMMAAFGGAAAMGVGAGAASTGGATGSFSSPYMQMAAAGNTMTDVGAGMGTAGGGYSVVPGMEGVGSTVTTGAGAGTGGASWLPAGVTPQMAMAGAGLGISAAGAMGGGDASISPNYTGPGRPSYFGMPFSSPAGVDINGNATEAMSNAGYNGSGYTGPGVYGAENASSGWSLPGNLGNIANWGASDWGNAVGGLAGIGSGIYGMSQANKLGQPIDFSANAQPNIDFTKMLPVGATMDFSAADPWGTSGGRDVAGAKLKGLLSDPSALYSMPGWQAGQEAVQRSMAAQGYTGSGNAMAALQKYGGDYYNQAIQQLTALSGGTQDPSTISRLQQGQQSQTQQQQQAAAQLALSQRGQNEQLQLGGAQLNTQREIAGNTLASQSLASLGYGGQRLLGGPQQQSMNPQAFQQMMQIYNMGKGLV